MAAIEVVEALLLLDPLLLDHRRTYIAILYLDRRFSYASLPSARALVDAAQQFLRVRHHDSGSVDVYAGDGERERASLRCESWRSAANAPKISVIASGGHGHAELDFSTNSKV